MTTETLAHPPRVLVVTAGETDGLPEAIQERVARARAEVLVVTPAAARFRGRSQPGDRRSEASRVAEERVCLTVEDLRLSGFEAEGMVGDADPDQAIEDALAVFDADVLVVDDDLAPGAGSRFSLPIVPVRAAP
jgi:hypothetical protein